MDDIIARINRIYAAIDAIEEDDPKKIKAIVIQTDKMIGIFQDFRAGFTNDDLSNQAHTVIHNIANLRGHLQRWAEKNGHDKAKVDQMIDNSPDLQIIMDLSNNDKHGYPPRDGGHSKKCAQLIEIDRVMRLQTKAEIGSMIAMTVGANGIPKFFGDGTAKAVVTGNVIDKDNKSIGDLYDIANKAVEAWEQVLTDFGLIGVTNGT